MVVESAGKRLAIECDGDRYHPMEKLAEDMARQAILERLGWMFIRIRGTAFYRNPDLAMGPVLARLGELDIQPEGSVEEGSASDMTLIHELDDLIQNGIGLETDEQITEAMEGQADDDGYDDDVAPTSATRILGFGHGQVEALLGTLGGTVQLEAFLRDFVKAKGFQRLGRNVRKGLQTELERLARKGKILMKDGIIRLP